MRKVILTELTTEELKSMIDDSVIQAYQRMKSWEEAKKESLLSRQEAASLIGVSLPTLSEYTKTGKVKGYRLGGRIKYKKSELLVAMTAVEPLKYSRG
jgi:excisionase family DNA binding protein